jgi:hypothetical protein
MRVTRKATPSDRVLVAVGILFAPRLAFAHGGGFELVLPAWFLGGFALLWALVHWNARARFKWATAGVVVLAAWVGGILANRWNDSTAPLDVASTWIQATVVVPALLFVTIRIFASRTNRPSSR